MMTLLQKLGNEYKIRQSKYVRIVNNYGSEEDKLKELKSKGYISSYIFQILDGNSYWDCILTQKGVDKVSTMSYSEPSSTVRMNASTMPKRQGIESVRVIANSSLKFADEKQAEINKAIAKLNSEGKEVKNIIDGPLQSFGPFGNVFCDITILWET